LGITFNQDEPPWSDAKSMPLQAMSGLAAGPMPPSCFACRDVDLPSLCAQCAAPRPGDHRSKLPRRECLTPHREASRSHH
jgi:hypothetical protein